MRVHRSAHRLILTKPLGVGVYSEAFAKDGLTEAQYVEWVASMERLNLYASQILAASYRERHDGRYRFRPARARTGDCAQCTGHAAVPSRTRSRRLRRFRSHEAFHCAKDFRAASVCGALRSVAHRHSRTSSTIFWWNRRLPAVSWRPFHLRESARGARGAEAVLAIRRPP